MATKPGYSAQPFRPYNKLTLVPETVGVPVPVVIDKSPAACSCQAGNGFEQKIKENPLVFVLGAALIGYLLAKN